MDTESPNFDSHDFNSLIKTFNIVFGITRPISFFSFDCNKDFDTRPLRQYITIGPWGIIITSEIVPCGKRVLLFAIRWKRNQTIVDSSFQLNYTEYVDVVNDKWIWHKSGMLECPNRNWTINYYN